MSDQRGEAQRSGQAAAIMLLLRLREERRIDW